MADLQRRLRVLVDGRALSDSNQYRGIGAFLRQLLSRLAHIPAVDMHVLATDRTELPAGVGRVRIRRVAPGRFQRLEHDVLLPRDLGRVDADLYYSPALQPPRRIDLPWVQTIHDVIPLTYEHPAFVRDRDQWRRWAERVSTASAWVADSAYTAQEAGRVLDIEPGRVHVAHLGVDPALLQAPRRHPEQSYLLFVGEYDPRKGHREAFDVTCRLAARGYPHVLKVVGRVAPWVEAELGALVASSARPERIELLGYVPEQELVALYAAAAALLVTSRAEGFGLPALEAMACGTPVVGFANSATAEVVGDAGWLVPDGDVEAAAEAVATIIDDPARWGALSAEGRRRSREFTWERCAATYASVFAAVAG